MLDDFDRVLQIAGVMIFAAGMAAMGLIWAITKWF